RLAFRPRRRVCPGVARDDRRRGSCSSGRHPGDRARPGAADPRPARVAVGSDVPDHRLGHREPGLPRARRQAGAVARRVVDELAWQVSFENPYAPFLAYAAGGTLSLVSPKAVRETGDLVHTRPVGSGPFMIKDYVAKDHTTMVRNPAYTRKAPWSDRAGGALLDSIVWKFVPEAGTRVTTLESGEAQGVYLVPAQSLPRIEKNTAMRVDKIPYPGAPRIWLLNTTKPPLDDVKVRRALNYAVDKEALLATVFKGIALKAFAPL